MKIEFSVQEYFNELKLMKKQYVQEEALYPWIYILLQMAECKKKKVLKEWYQQVSIRDVHNGRYCKFKPSYINWKLRWELYKNVGFPDFAIICNDKITGCVEVKALKDKLFENEKKQKEYIFELETVCEELIHDGKDKATKKIKYKPTIKSINKAEDLLKKYADTIKPSINIKYENNPLPIHGKYKNKNQILGHLVKFGKVIYTNGLEFYLLTISKENAIDKKYKINVKELANLTDWFERYENGDMSSHELLLEATTEWEKLIAGLSGINWHAEPTTLINEINK